jgi:hypothetical protein
MLKPVDVASHAVDAPRPEQRLSHLSEPDRLKVAARLVALVAALDIGRQRAVRLTNNDCGSEIKRGLYIETV